MCDVVIWGATGYTGRLISRYFASNVARRFPQLTWAVAGRSPGKLDGLRRDLADEHPDVPPPLSLHADPAVQQDLNALAAGARVVIAAAGPFSKVGQGMVHACFTNKCDYVDITGEAPWVRRLGDQYHELGEQRKSLIVPMCGFDSVPSDLTTFAAVGKLWRDFGQPAHRVRTYVAMRGTSSGGTIKTGLLLQQRYAAEYNDPHLLTSLSHSRGRGGSSDGAGTESNGDAAVAVSAWEADLRSAEWDDWALGGGGAAGGTSAGGGISAGGSGVWTAPFMMARINTRVVRRSNALFQLGRDGPAGAGYDGVVADTGREPAVASPALGFQFSERAVAPSEAVAKKMAKTDAVPTEIVEKLVERQRLPQPGQGPSEDQRQAAWFQFTTIAEAPDGSRAAVKMAGGDGGYEETAKMVSEAALCALQDRRTLRRRGGVLTPAVAFGERLRGRLAAQGLPIVDMVRPPTALGDFFPDGRAPAASR